MIFVLFLFIINAYGFGNLPIIQPWSSCKRSGICHLSNNMNTKKHKYHHHHFPFLLFLSSRENELSSLSIEENREKKWHLPLIEQKQSFESQYPISMKTKDEDIKDLIKQIRSINTSILQIRRQYNGGKDMNHFLQQKETRKPQQKIFHKAIPYCRSLVHLLRQNSHLTQHDSNKNTFDYKHIIDGETINTLRDALSRVTVQTLRVAADVNDYNLIREIINVSIEFASYFSTNFFDHNLAQIKTNPNSLNHNDHDGKNNQIVELSSTSNIQPSIIILQTRLFGEAIRALARTTAGYSKLRQTWQDFQTSILTGICSYPQTAMEMNSMIEALHSRKRIKAALSLYHENKDFIPVDAFTASVVLDVLESSMMNDENDIYMKSHTKKSKKIDDINKKHSYISMSRALRRINLDCWQWKESLKILNDLEKKHHHQQILNHHNQEFEREILNNHVYFKMLQLNELVMTRSEERGYLHDGYSFVISILERMQRTHISPDVITCTAIMSVFDKAQEWNAAYLLLDAMRKSKPLDLIDSLTSHSSIPINALNGSTAIISSSISSNKSNNNNTSIYLDWTIPKPNIYTYSAAISACAGANQRDIALHIFDLLKEDEQNAEEQGSDNSTSISLYQRNTWVYNTLLKACCNDKLHSRNSKKNKKKDRSKGYMIALDLLHKMEEDALLRKMNTMPNTVTYNTIISTLIGVKVLNELETLSDVFDIFDGSEDTNHKSNELLQDQSIYISPLLSQEEIIVTKLISKMQKQNITRNVITYHNSLLACSKHSPEAVSRILSLAFADRQAVFSHADSSSEDVLLSAKDLTSLVNTAISLCVSHGEMNMMMDIFKRHINVHSDLKSNADDRIITVKPDKTTLFLMVKGMCKVGEEESALHLLHAFHGDKESAHVIFDLFKIKIQPCTKMLDERPYFTIIGFHIKKDNISKALEVLKVMKAHGKFTPNIASLTSIIITCSKKAIKAASKEIRMLKRFRQKEVDVSNIDRSISQSRANAAYMLFNSIKSQNVPSSVVFSVAKASASSGLWENAFILLNQIHELSFDKQVSMEEEKRRGKLSSLTRFKKSESLKMLPKLHRDFLNVCATTGDVSNALKIVDKIIRFHQKLLLLTTGETRQIINHINLKIAVPDKAIDIIDTSSLPDVPSNVHGEKNKEYERLGMDGQNWTLLIIAAAKANQWQICLNTLQIIRSYVEETNPQTMAKKDNDHQSLKLHILNKQYRDLCPALSSTILCLESSKQYAWTIRVVDDWMKWSGRRPPKGSLIVTCRVLASHGKGQQAIDIVSRAMKVVPYATLAKDLNQNQMNFLAKLNYDYGSSIFSYVVHALHKNGMYIFADEMYVEGVTKGFLLWPIMEENNTPLNSNPNAPLQLDLHGMSLAIAHSAVRTALQKEVQRISINDNISPLDDQEWLRDVKIITGKGINSAERFRPILRPEVQRMLTEEFYPPLSTTSLPNNIGALLIPAKDVDLWLSYQRKQRGAHMLTVAEMLKSVAGVTKLKRSLLKVGKNSITDGNFN